jgi:hypothetical protein
LNIEKRKTGGNIPKETSFKQPVLTGKKSIFGRYSAF